MADMFWNNAYKPTSLNAVVGSAAQSEDFLVGLFTANVTVSDTTALSALTEATFTGYARVSVPRSSFAAAALAGNVAYALSSVSPAFTCTGGSGQTCYGWFMIGATSGTLVAAQNFSTPRAITSGLTEYLTPFQIGLASF